MSSSSVALPSPVTASIAKPARRRKTCLNCGKPLTWRQHRVAEKRGKARKYCDELCGQRYRKRKWWQAVGKKRRRIDQRVRRAINKELKKA